MRSLIDDLLDHSRVDTKGKEFSLVNMNEVVGNDLKVLKASIEDSEAEIIVGPLPTITGDETQMSQVMQNLIANAIKFDAVRNDRWCAFLPFGTRRNGRSPSRTMGSASGPQALTVSSKCSRGCQQRASVQGRVSVSRYARRWSNVVEEGSGSSRRSTRERPSSLSPREIERAQN